MYTRKELINYRIAVFLRKNGKSYAEIGNDLNRSKSCIKTVEILNGLIFYETKCDLLLERKLEWNYAVRKPRLTESQNKSRKNFCLNVKSSNKAKWRQIMFSDEMKIEIDNRKNRIQIRRMPSEKYNEDRIVKRTKQGSCSIEIWCCMSYHSLGNLTDKKLFQNINPIPFYYNSNPNPYYLKIKSLVKLSFTIL
ncbi:Transposable element Tcb1 [Brachionus plicatilis]|uniref:Transposable element Tcb1 n=1 Tax=Brachionus plicatilis TaxID=10195 RepID=A0A3M7QTX0_BRAPC|nr:Transposable element Tcb1 [Brachionus plicatilis]